MIKDVLSWYETETIREEQVQKVLASVVRRIKAGEFDRPRNVGWLMPPLTAVAAVGILVMVIMNF